MGKMKKSLDQTVGIFIISTTLVSSHRYTLPPSLPPSLPYRCPGTT